MLTKLMLISALSISLSHAGTNEILDEAWQGFSAPEIMASGFTHKLKELPLEGSVEIGPKAWSGHYWPSQEGGINVRWNHPAKEGFKYKSPSKEQVKRMSLNELATLAPTEKYDLFIGQYDYPMKELAATAASRRAPDWAGICHGWAPATLHHNEPSPKIVTNPDGIQIPFGSSDIKALLSYYYAFHHESEGSNQVGLRCFFGRWMGGARACQEDLNAGAFHIVISNMLGIRHEGFLADVDRYKEVWNQPIVAYKSKIVADNLAPSKGAAESAVKEMKVETDFFYVDEVDNVTWDVVHGTKDQLIAKKSYAYRLEINAYGNIVGGSWDSDERPDFLWNKEKATTFTGILSLLPQLLND
jgi:hypothetical protein